MKYINIAIDGPSGAGKSTMAKAFAAKFGFIYVDTGALYRSIGLYAKRNGISLSDIADTVKLLSEIKLQLKYENNGQRVILNGEDVSDLIRTPEISMYASAVSAIPEVRSFLLDLQRDIAKNNNVIMDGRDIGTVILPNADVKIYLTASPEERAKRRYKELIEKGMDVNYDDVLSDIIKRDNNDSSRDIAPAKPADDAVMFNNSQLTVEESLRRITEIAKEELGDVLQSI